MIYDCPAWEIVEDTNLMKLQRLQNGDFCTIHNFPRRASVRDMHVDFKLPYAYDHIKKHKSFTIMKVHVLNIGPGEAQYRKCMRIKLGASQAYDHSSDQTAIVA
jgi:hypothetical protein